MAKADVMSNLMHRIVMFYKQCSTAFTNIVYHVTACMPHKLSLVPRLPTAGLDYIIATCCWESGSGYETNTSCGMHISFYQNANPIKDTRRKTQALTDSSHMY